MVGHTPEKPGDRFPLVMLPEDLQRFPLVFCMDATKLTPTKLLSLMSINSNVSGALFGSNQDQTDDCGPSPSASILCPAEIASHQSPILIYASLQF